MAELIKAILDYINQIANFFYMRERVMIMVVLSIASIMAVSVDVEKYMEGGNSKSKCQEGIFTCEK